MASPTAASAAEDPGGSDDPPVGIVAGGLDGPRQLSEYRGDELVVAESDSGEISSVDPHSGEVETLVTGLYTPQGVDYDDGHLYIAVGEAAPPEDSGAPPVPEGAATSALLVADEDGTIVEEYDLLAYELANNPDGQVQFVEGQPVDALSNPFSVLVQDDRILVADGGANDVLAIDRESGEISTFFVPPVVDDVEACMGAENNPGTIGCDSVPTEITEGPDGHIYLGTLGALAPGAARVYVLDQDGGEVDRIEGLTGVTGVAVDSDGTVYVSDVIEGAPEGDGPPPAGFDPATVGVLTRIDGDDTRTTLQATMPVGLETDGDDLYSTAWSVAGFVGLMGRGEVVEVDPDAFQ
jgi:hypothetical protein